MDEKQFQAAIQFYLDEGCTERIARKLASNASSIVFNAKRKDDAFIELVLFGIRNGYFAGLESA